MEKFKVKKKHIVGALEGFPKHIVQLMVDEQVNQGNKADPSVFANRSYADKAHGGFNWHDAKLSPSVWSSVIDHREFDAIPKPKGHVHAKLMRKYAKDAMTSERPWELWEFNDSVMKVWRPLNGQPVWNTLSQYRRKGDNSVESLTPNEIIKAMLDKGMTVWAAVSDSSYDDARTHMTKSIHRVIEVGSDVYPIQTDLNDWRFAIPVNTATMTEITELP